MSESPQSPRVDADGVLRLSLAGAIPHPLPEDVRRVTVESPMPAHRPTDDMCARLADYHQVVVEDRDLELRLDLRVDAENWIQLPSWAIEAANLGICTQIHLAPESDPKSLFHVDHYVLATARQVLRRWGGSPWGAHLQAGSGFTQIRRWQQELQGDQHLHIALPDCDHSLFADEDLAMGFLADFLRIFAHPYVVDWLGALVASDCYAERFRRSRPLRFAGYWLVASAQKHDALPAISRFDDAAHVLEVHEADLAATRGTEWECWYDYWVRELRIENLLRTRVAFPGLDESRGVSAGPARATVIIPSYCHEAFIGRTLQSVLGQTATDIEILVSDDASTDGTVAAARAIGDSRVRVLAHEENRGLGRNLAAALGQVRTPYVALLNSDDLFDPRRVERCLEVLESDESIDLVATDLHPIDAQDRLLDRESASVLTEGYKVCHWLDWFSTLGEGLSGDLLGDLLRANFLLTSSNLFGRRQFFLDEQARWLDQEFCLDWQLLLAAAQRDGLYYLREPLLGYRLHAGNTVWFDEERAWRFFIEVHQVAAQVLSKELAALSGSNSVEPRRLLELLSGPIQHNTGLDGSGLLAGLFVEGAGLSSRRLNDASLEHAKTLFAQAERRHDQRRFAEELAGRREAVHRMLGQIEFLRSYRLRGEVMEELAGELEVAVGRHRADAERLEDLWQRTVGERDREIESKAALQGQLDLERGERRALEEDREGLTEELRKKVAVIEEQEERRHSLQKEMLAIEEQLSQANERLSRANEQLEQALRRLDERTGERDQVLQSGEYRLGKLVFHKMKLFPVLRATETGLALLRHTAQRWRLRLESWFAGRPRIMATACWNFPIYSQTFVHQELSQLQKKGFAVRVCYSHLEARDHLPPAMRGLWPARRRLLLHRKVNHRDFEHYRRRMPEKVERLIELICQHSGRGRDFVLSHDNFAQAFSYTRQAEALGVDYLHSYFFYDRSFMSLVAGYILDRPRGVSCYADHQLDDYEFKLIPLHLELCDVVIATSARIKRELLAIHPGVDPDKILVKPNAVDSETFPVVEREDPPSGEPFRIVCVNRIEPKKGLTYLAEAVRLLNERGLKVEMHQVGEADHGIQSSVDYKQLLVEQLERDQLWGKVHLEGRQDADGVRRFLGMSQLFLAPFVETDAGDKDGIPTALMEAMATGIAIVSTDAGSMTEVIDDGVEGLVVREKDAVALADAIESLLRDPERRKQLGRAAAQKVREKFDVRVCEKWFHNRLESLLRARGVKTP